MDLENVSAYQTNLYLKKVVYAIKWRIPNFKETSS